MKLVKKILLCLVVVAVVAACDSSVLYSESHRVDEEGWKASDNLVFNYVAEDTTQTMLCCFDIRNLNTYPYSNIYFNIKTVFPDGSVAVDTNLQFMLSEKDGRWLGRESGRYIDGRYPFCYFRFPELGSYQFVVSHAMRDTILPGIRNVGLVIKKQ